MINKSTDDIDWESMLRAQSSDYCGADLSEDNHAPMTCVAHEHYEDNDMALISMLNFHIYPKPASEDSGSEKVNQKSEGDSLDNNEN